MRAHIQFPKAFFLPAGLKSRRSFGAGFLFTVQKNLKESGREVAVNG